MDNWVDALPDYFFWATQIMVACTAVFVIVSFKAVFLSRPKRIVMIAGPIVAEEIHRIVGRIAEAAEPSALPHG